MYLSNIEMLDRINPALLNFIHNPDFNEFTDLINRYKISVKIDLSTTYHVFESEEFFYDTNNLGYLYKNEFLDYLTWKNLSEPSLLTSTKEKAEKYFELSQKLIFLYKKGLLTDIENEVYDTQEIIEMEWEAGSGIKKFSESLGPISWNRAVYNTLIFSIGGVTIFQLGGNKGSTNEAEDFILKADNQNYFKSLLHTDSDIPDFTQQRWYPLLDPQSQALISSGTQYIKMFLANEKELKDYSPILLNFCKALESEFKHYYDKNLDYILPLADLVSNSRELILDKFNNKKQGESLVELCTTIKKFKKAYRFCGYKPISYILYYLGLGEELKKHLGVEGYLTNDEKIIVRKEMETINRIFDTSNDRNRYCHDLMIQSRTDFLLYYNDVFLVLDLLTSIK